MKESRLVPGAILCVKFTHDFMCFLFFFVVGRSVEDRRSFPPDFTAYAHSLFQFLAVCTWKGERKGRKRTARFFMPCGIPVTLHVVQHDCRHLRIQRVAPPPSFPLSPRLLSRKNRSRSIRRVF